MARLLEHEAKDILKAGLLRVPRGIVVQNSFQTRKAALEIGLPVMLKAQVLGGSRLKDGLIKTAVTPDEAARLAEELLRNPTQERSVDAVLVEEKYIFDKEYYLAIVSDESTCSPLILFSTQGGVNAEEYFTDSRLRRRHIHIMRGIQPDDLAYLTDGFSGNRPALIHFIRAAYELYRTQDCRLLEINPFVETERGLVALDARVEIDEDALFRHKDTRLHLTEENLNRRPTELELTASLIDQDDHRGTVHIIQLDHDAPFGSRPRVALDCVGTGVSLAVMDEIMERGYLLVNFADTSGNPTGAKLYRAIKLIFSQRDIEGFIFASCVSSQQLDNTARGIIKAFKEIFAQTGGKPTIPCVFMFRGGWDREAIELFRMHGISGSPFVSVLDRDHTEEDVAVEFDRLYRSYQLKKDKDHETVNV